MVQDIKKDDNMKTKYDKEIEKLERGTTKVDARLKKLRQERDKSIKPYDEEIGRIQRTLHEGYLEICTLKHNRKIWIRNQELQKNKDLFSKGMNFRDLLLTGDGKFSDYKYFLKSGSEVIPVLHLFVEGIESEDEIRKKAKEILSDDEIEHLSRAFWGRYLEFDVDSSVESIRTLYQNGFKFKAYAGFHREEEAIEVKESNETMKKRMARSCRTANYPLKYVRNPETITVVKKEKTNES